MHIIGAEIHEKRSIRFASSSVVTFAFATMRCLLRHVHTLFHPVDGISRDGIGDVFVFPQRLSAPLHVANARDAIDNAHIVAV